VEGVELTPFRDVYRGRRVLLTGHTGFKGSWLALWLTELGASVTGLSLQPPTSPSHWDLLGLQFPEHRLDIREASGVEAVVTRVRPEIVFHLAAQSLVWRSHREPVDTWSTNVVGTANVLEACRHASSLRAIVVVTSDKCYENSDAPRSHRETDPLGGRDPYSASKAAAELVAASYRTVFLHGERAPLLATARAGNVIGGGDWSEDRLIPDLARAVAAGSALEIRSPDATRPWQHVLESLSAYLLLGQMLLQGDRSCEGAWNFGPAPGSGVTVTDVLARLREFWPGVEWRTTSQPQPREAQSLSLDSSKARAHLGWRPVWSLDVALRATAEWYRRYYLDQQTESRSQLLRYVVHAREAGLEWARA
jgi:CDP-glucose 4,6-dehydratase